MPEVTYSTEIAASPEAVWAYVERLENWAPYVIGFQDLQVVDERQSIWRLRGDVGILAREVEIRADIDVWEEPRLVEFTVTGITERLEGGGRFVLEPLGGPDDPGQPSEAGDEGGSAHRTEPSRPGALARLRGAAIRFRDAGARFLLRRLDRRKPGAGGGGAGGGAPARPSEPAGGAEPAAARARPLEGSRFTFTLRVTPGGPMAPMLEVLMGPMMDPAAEDVATKIRDALEA